MRRLIFLIVLINSCTFSEDKKNEICFNSQVGTYKLDIPKTIQNYSDSVPFLSDSMMLKKFIINFRSDSTFSMNMKVDFFSDTCGTWASGGCHFESSGTLKYANTPSEEQFGLCRYNDSFFTKLSYSYLKHGPITVHFKKIF